jgi:hypothetical protein
MVWPASHFRYFPIKSETVLCDRLDPVFLEVFLNQPADLSPLAAIRAAMHEVMTSLNPDESTLEEARWQLIGTVPELRTALGERMGRLSGMLVEAVAERVDRDPTDLAVRVRTGALIGALNPGCVRSARGWWRRPRIRRPWHLTSGRSGAAPVGPLTHVGSSHAWGPSCRVIHIYG